MFFTCFQADGCQLPNGVKIPNGWNHLYNNCQERCQCENNNFSCIPNTCDLSKNICIRDELGDSCQGAVFVVGLVQPVIIHFDGKIVRIRKITFFIQGEITSRFEPEIGALNFEYDDHYQGDNGCGSLLMGQFWLFGGKGNWEGRNRWVNLLII